VVVVGGDVADDQRGDKGQGLEREREGEGCTTTIHPSSKQGGR